MAVKRNYRINLRNYGNPPAIMVSQYDENYALTFEVYDGPLPASGLNVYTVKLVGTRADTLAYSFDGTVSGLGNNVLSFTIDTTMTACAGKGVAELVILDTSNDVKFASFNLLVYVEKAAVPDDAIDADVERAQEIADEVAEIVDGATEGAEAWAVGQRGGVDVENTDPTYHNNAKYYAESISGVTDQVATNTSDISDLKEDLNAEYVGYKGTLTSADNLFALTYGVYFIPATAGDKPTNLPSDFARNHNGFAIILGTSNNSVLTAIAVDLYAKKVWLYTGYGWNEIPNTDRVNALITTAINSALGEVEDSSIVTSNFISKFIAWGWNGNTTRGFRADSTRLSIISPQHCPYDIVLSNLSSNFSVCTIRIFTGTSTVPDNLVSTTQYTVNKGISGYVDSIILPKNTYWTIELSKPNNVEVDTSVDPDYLHFSISTSIVGDAFRASRTLLVGKTGAPYTTIQSACDDAINGDTILILPGTYVEQVSIWGKRLNLIGLDRESTIIKDTSGLYSTPTLEMNIGSLKNLTLIETGEDNPWGADEGRSYAYTMHIESGEGYTGIGELWVDNCKFINNKHAAIGCGLYQDLHVHFNNCYMYSGRASDLPDNYYRGTFYFHTNRQDNVTGQRMTVKDCEIINESTKVFYGGVVSPGAQTGNVRSTFINNNFYAMEAENNNSNDVIISSSILNYHDCKLAVNSRGNNIPALNSV